MSHLVLGQQSSFFKLHAAPSSMLNNFAAIHQHSGNVQRNNRPKNLYQAALTEATEAAPQTEGTSAAEW